MNSPLTDAALVAEVLRRPNVLWALISGAHAIASPWQREGQSSRYARGRVLPVAAVTPLGYGPHWQGHCLGAMTDPHAGLTREQCEAWCDDQLRAEGWALADHGVTP